MSTVDVAFDEKVVQKETLGNVRLRHHETNEIILVPTPTDEPSDPLSWPKGYRLYIAGLVTFAIFLSNFLAAGPTVAIVNITNDFFHGPASDFAGNIAKTSYFFTTSALLQGLGNLVWMPAIVKYGRRPVYVISFLLYTVTAAWAGASTSYGSELAARIFLGFFSGAAECLAPLTIADCFFLHERGTIMVIYTAGLSAGVGSGIVISGLITINLHWRYIYWVSVALVGFCTVLIIFSLPETEFERAAFLARQGHALVPHTGVEGHAKACDEQIEASAQTEVASTVESGGVDTKKHTRLQTLRIFSGSHTKESIWKLMLRPVVLLALPPVLWATLVMSVTIGFLVAISSNFATAFQGAYGFAPWQSGLCFFSSIIGSLIAIFFGGRFSDLIADIFTRRNGGVREPEMRLPAMAISLVAGPLALILYGVGIGKGLHWIVPTLGLGLLNFAIVQATNITLVYTIDSYRPVAGEITVAQFAFKSAFGFLLSFYTNPWIAKSGYERAFGAMAGISGAVILLWVPFYIYGKKIRHLSWNWGFVRRLAHWDEDREVGE